MISPQASSWIDSVTGNLEDNQDCLVPATISETTTEHHVAEYAGDDNGFYCQLSKSELSSPYTSGTSTPTGTTDDIMERFMMFPDDWPGSTIPSMSLIAQAKDEQQHCLSLVDQQDYKHVSTSSSGDNNSEFTDSSSEDGQQAGQCLPDILTRPVKNMTNEDKRLRRKELNRLAAQRSRQKKKSVASTFEKEVKRLTKRNADLRLELISLETSKTKLYENLKKHFKLCRSNNTRPNPSNFNNFNDGQLKRAAAADAKLETLSPCRANVSEATNVYSSSGGRQAYTGHSNLSQGFDSAFD